MTTRTWSAGFGGQTGDPLAIEAPITVSGNVWYVDSQTGSDSNAGTREDAPFATIAAALAVAAAHDVIFCLSGHTQTVTAVMNVTQIGLTILGAGASAGLPTVKLKMNSGSNPNLFNVTAAGVNIFGIYFQSNTVANTSPTVAIAAANCAVRNCYFEGGSTDDGPGLSLTAGVAGFRLENTIFASIATSVATRPVTGFRCNVASSHLYMNGVIVDAGTYGYSAYGVNLATTVTGLKCENLSLLRGGDMFVEPASVGYVNSATVSGGAVLVW